MTHPPQPETNLKELFEQFKFHLIYQNKHKQTKTGDCEELKSLLSQLKQDSKIKRDRKRMLGENATTVTKNSQIRPASTIQSRVWKPSSIDTGTLDGMGEEILIIEKEKQNLQEEISRLQNSLSELKKNVRNLRKMTEIEGSKEEKFKHISYLSKSIQRNTDSTKIINYRSFKKMVNQQEETLASLKKFKSTLRKENEDMQAKFMQKQSKPLNTASSPKIDNYAKPQADCQTMSEIKIDRSFMNKLEELLQLFISKEQEFEQIKAEQTTKIRLKKIQKMYLKEDRVRLHDMIDRFQQKYDVKIESLANLIVYIFKRLNQDNNEMENECIKRYQIKQTLIQDLQGLREKKKMMVDDERKDVIERFSPEQEAKRMKIYTNSQMFIKFIVLIHNLLGKFKYLFTMALTLSMQKKNFQDLLIQINNIYKSNSIFFQKEEDTTIGCYEQLTNFKEMEEIFEQYGGQFLTRKQEFLGFIFSDLRYSLIFRREWMEEQLKEGLQQGLLLQKMENIHEKCEEIFDSKLKIYSLILINSIKALVMNKYEKKMIAHSTACQTLFLVPNLRKQKSEEREDSDFNERQENHRNENKFNSEESEEDVTAIEFSSDPRKMVQLLEKVKNEEKVKFRHLNFEPQLVYMYNSKVVVPKYTF